MAAEPRPRRVWLVVGVAALVGLAVGAIVAFLLLHESTPSMSTKPSATSAFEEISGASTGTTERTVRVVPDTGLVVELRLVVDVRNDSPVGDVHYVERYRMRLTSLLPHR